MQRRIFPRATSLSQETQICGERDLISPQKRRIFPQKTPISTLQRPISPPCRDEYFQELHLFRKRPGFPGKETYISTKETRMSAKKICILIIETYLSTVQRRVFLRAASFPKET